MPPPLHPKSRLTSSLFATTLFAAFFVVSLPHVLPSCPAPRVAYADDGEGHPRRRRRRRRRACPAHDGESATAAEGGSIGCEGEESMFESSGLEGRRRRRSKEKRECPVPKPGGLVGEIMGFKTPSSTQTSIPTRSEHPSSIVVEAKSMSLSRSTKRDWGQDEG